MMLTLPKKLRLPLLAILLSLAAGLLSGCGSDGATGVTTSPLPQPDINCDGSSCID